jgi:DNA-binding transcriptional LysR family regulator
LVPKLVRRHGREDVPFGAIDLRALTLAIAVSRSGSIRTAALKEGLTAPALSRRIRTLEDILGVSLFERRTSGMRTTDAGDRFLHAANRMLTEMEEAADRAREAGSASIGSLVIGTYFSVSTGRFRDVLLHFVKQHRRVMISLMEGRRCDLVAAVRQGKADVALLIGPMDEPGLDRLVLWQEAGMVALREDHRLAGSDMIQWKDLSGETFVLARRGSGSEVRKKVLHHLPRGGTVRFHEHNVGREGMFNLVSAGLGVAALTESATGVNYPGVSFRPVGDVEPTLVEVDAYYDPRRDNPTLRRFLVALRTAQLLVLSPGIFA